MSKELNPFLCTDWHREGDDIICNLHGFMWPVERPFCNYISDELKELLVVHSKLLNSLEAIKDYVKYALEGVEDE